MERLDNSKLSPVQKHIVNRISKEKKLAIVGGPGTGKTVLAMAGMRKNSDSKQILLTYSKPLSKMINGCSVESLTIHKFCHELGKEITEKLNNLGLETEKEESFASIAIEKYGYKKTGWPQWDILYRDYTKLPLFAQKEIRYDDIFIDEGQDLPNEAYEVFSKIADRIIVTYDDAQEVGRENYDDELIRKAGIECNRITSVLGIQETFYDLIDNFRNTASIEHVAKLFYNNYGNNAISLRPSVCKRNIGSLPEVLFSDATQEIIDKIADTAYQLNKHIGIIVPDKETFINIRQLMQNAIIRGILPNSKFFFKYGNLDNMNSAKNDAELNQSGVFLTTYKTSKGMEFDEVYLFNCQKIVLNKSSDKNKFYVAITRAKDKLSLFFDCSYDCDYDVLKVIKEHEDMFKIVR